MVRLACRAVLVFALIALGGSAPRAANVSESQVTGSGSSGVTVKELDLAGVHAEALGQLPAVDPQPDDRSLQPTDASPTSGGTAPTTTPTPDPASAPPTGESPMATTAVPDPDVLTTEIATAPFTGSSRLGVELGGGAGW